MQQNRINYLDLASSYNKDKKKYLKIFDEVMGSGQYIPQKNVQNFEDKICKFLKVKYCASLNSGTDALLMALYSLNLKRGDEIITTPNTWYSTIASVIHVGLVPKFIDIKLDQNFNEDLIEKNITKKTKAILAVHLNGKMTNVIKIRKICKKYKLKFIEDAAQALGASYEKVSPGQLSDIACFSTHPTKTLFSFRDGGYVVSNNKRLINKIKLLRNHGIAKNNRDECDEFGFNSRMDELQSKILIERLKEIKTIIKLRNLNASIYQKYLNKKYFFCDFKSKNLVHSYQFFLVLCNNRRDELFEYLNKKKTIVLKYFHIPIYKQNAFKKLYPKKIKLKNTELLEKRSLNLPIRENLKETEIKYICQLMNRFYEK
ncbi:DegT/DnrJ/EryC1/StrS family aminotransferase [Candidatus Pelagibacter sp.]|nr:DegT/DnrJ/EryC1/StrS family aminotransferase [Candidatus Pelagibacter sp.]